MTCKISTDIARFRFTTSTKCKLILVTRFRREVKSLRASDKGSLGLQILAEFLVVVLDCRLRKVRLCILCWTISGQFNTSIVTKTMLSVSSPPENNAMSHRCLNALQFCNPVIRPCSFLTDPGLGPVFPQYILWGLCSVIRLSVVLTSYYQLGGFAPLRCLRLKFVHLLLEGAIRIDASFVLF